MEKATGELLELLKKSTNLSDYREAAKEDIKKPIALSVYLKSVMERKGLKKSEVIRNAGLPRSYGYEILNGEKIPSRDRVLAICFSLRLTSDEVQELLKRTEYPLLYPKHERDSVILFGFSHKLSLYEVNELLYEMNQRILETEKFV